MLIHLLMGLAWTLMTALGGELGDHLRSLESDSFFARESATRSLSDYLRANPGELKTLLELTQTHGNPEVRRRIGSAIHHSDVREVLAEFVLSEDAIKKGVWENKTWDYHTKERTDAMVEWRGRELHIDTAKTDSNYVMIQKSLEADHKHHRIQIDGELKVISESLQPGHVRHSTAIGFGDNRIARRSTLGPTSWRCFRPRNALRLRRRAGSAFGSSRKETNAVSFLTT